MLVPRIISSVVLIPLVLFLLFFSKETTALGCTVAGLLGAYEFYSMARRAPARYYPIQLPGYILVLALNYAAYLGNFLLMLLAVVLLAIFSLGAIWLRRQLQPQIDEGKNRFLNNWGLSVFGAVYAALPMSLVSFIRSSDTANGLWWLTLAFVGTWGTDIFAYVFGRIFGKRPLAPKISPKKTLEGAIGGAVFGTLAVVLVGFFSPLNLPIYLGIPLGLATSIGAIGGDLFESWVKRRFDTKDSSKLIPGHGGVLDRIDGFLVVSLLVFGFFQIYIRL